MNAPHLIGRIDELTSLQASVHQADAGHGRVVLLAGEAGFGKTSIAQEVLRRSQHRVLAGRARLDVSTPYGPITSMLREHLRQSGTTPASLLSPYLALLLPELGPAPVDPGAEVLLEAILDAFLAAARQQTTILFLEDLQWADIATLELLPLLAERIADTRMLVLATYRSDEINRGHPLRSMRQELRRTHNLHELHIEPLDCEMTARLLQETLGRKPNPALVELVFHKTHGIPLYVEELARALESSGHLHAGDDGTAILSGKDVPVPESVRDLVLLRLDALSETARQTLDIAALIGLEFDLEMVAVLVGSEDSIGELIDHQLIYEAQPNIGAFRHTLIREVIRNEIAWSRRRSLSRRIATFLERQGASPEQVVEHWLVAREQQPAVRALLEMAERSCRLHAYQDAASAAHRALENWPEQFDEARRIETLQRLAQCSQIGGQLGDAIKALREAASSEIVQNDTVRLANLLRDLATVYGLQGSQEQAQLAHRQSAEAFERAGMQADASIEYLAVAGSQTASSALEAALKTLQRAERLAVACERQDLLVRARGHAGNVQAMLGRLDEGRDLAQQALSLALQSGEDEAAAEAYRRLASVLDYSSDFSGARDAYATAVNYCRTQGDDPNRTACLGCMSAIVYRTGEWKRALEIIKELITMEAAPVGSRAIAHTISGLIQAVRGEVRPARRSLQRGLTLARSKNIAVVDLSGQFGQALLAELEEDHATAQQLHRQVLEGWRQTEDRHDLVPCFHWQATYFSRIGEHEETARRAEVLTHLASSTGNVETIASLAHALGEVALLSGDPVRATEHFEQALERMQRLEIPLEQALSLWRCGHALAQAGQKEPAASRMHTAYRTLRRLGARPLARWVRSELQELGERVEEGRAPDAGAHKDRGGLTRRQVEIVRLLAQGFTNKEIATRLFLSSRTVDMHVSNILDRLDCAGRTEAAHKASELGLLTSPETPNQ